MKAIFTKLFLLILLSASPCFADFNKITKVPLGEFNEWNPRCYVGESNIRSFCHIEKSLKTSNKNEKLIIRISRRGVDDRYLLQFTGEDLATCYKYEGSHSVKVYIDEKNILNLGDFKEGASSSSKKEVKDFVNQMMSGEKLTLKLISKDGKAQLLEWPLSGFKQGFQEILKLQK